MLADRLRLVRDHTYGVEQGTGHWNGMIGELVRHVSVATIFRLIFHVSVATIFRLIFCSIFYWNEMIGELVRHVSGGQFSD